MDDDGSSSTGGPSSSSVNTTPPQIVLALMEDVLEKLKLLNYETYLCKARHIKPFSRVHFAIPGSSKPGELLLHFAFTVSFLSSYLGRRYDPPDPFDPDFLSRIYMELQACGVSCSFPHHRLRSGYGYEVCFVLNEFCDIVLKKQNVQLGSPIYPSAGDMNADDAADIDDDIDDDAIQDDIQLSSSDEEDIRSRGTVSLGRGMLASSRSSAGTSKDFSRGSSSTPSSTTSKTESSRILETSTDPIEWKMELERVAPRLQMKVSVHSQDWRGHLDQLKQLRSSISEILPQSENLLTSLSKSVSSHLEKIQRREKSLVSEYSELINQFREKHVGLQKSEEEYRSKQDRVNELNKSLNDISEELEDVKIQMDERGNVMNDTSPLVRLKEALSQIKNEIQQMNLQTGILQNALLQEEVKARKRVTSAGRRSRSK